MRFWKAASLAHDPKPNWSMISPRSTTMKTHRHLLAIIACTIFGLGLLGEAGCRWGIGLGQVPVYVTDTAIEYALAPEQNVRRFHKTYLVNAQGMRAPALVPGLRPVLVLGDSVVNGGVQTDQAALATSLASANGIPWTQAAAGSWGPPNQWAWLQRHGATVAPRAIVWVLSAHDRYDVPDFSPLNPATHPTAQPWCALGDLVFTYGARLLPGTGPARDPMADRTPERIAACASAASAVAGWCRDRGVPLTVVLHPERDEADDSADLNAWRAFWATQQVPVVLAGPMYAPKNEAYRDGIHLNAVGQARLATIFSSIALPQ
jgi:hypothetical protein